MNDRVVAANWPNAPAGLQRVTPSPAQVIAPVADLCRAIDGARDRQVLFGDVVAVLERRDGWAFVRAEKDGYVGYLRDASLGEVTPTTHWVSAPSTHLYSQADFKTPERGTLTLGVRVQVTGETERFCETPDGHIPRPHLRPLGTPATDPIAVAERFLGTPYLWGGNSRWGIDCSGLVQAAILACGQACAGDSDQQEATLGYALPHGSDMRYGDILFWRGHVGLVAGDTLLHANAFHMAVVHEPLSDAIARIASQGDGPITAHRRIKPTR